MIIVGANSIPSRIAGIVGVMAGQSIDTTGGRVNILRPNVSEWPTGRSPKRRRIRIRDGNRMIRILRQRIL